MDNKILICYKGQGNGSDAYSSAKRIKKKLEESDFSCTLFDFNEENKESIITASGESILTVLTETAEDYFEDGEIKDITAKGRMIITCISDNAPVSPELEKGLLIDLDNESLNEVTEKIKENALKEKARIEKELEELRNSEKNLEERIRKSEEKNRENAETVTKTERDKKVAVIFHEKEEGVFTEDAKSAVELFEKLVEKKIETFFIRETRFGENKYANEVMDVINRVDTVVLIASSLEIYMSGHMNTIKEYCASRILDTDDMELLLFMHPGDMDDPEVRKYRQFQHFNIEDGVDAILPYILTGGKSKDTQVFISFKDSLPENDEAAKTADRTEDAAKGEELYNALTALGVNVFFSRETLRGRGNAVYKEEIDKSIEKSRIMIVIGTTPGYISSKWVAYEWTSFFEKNIRNNNTGSCKLFTYDYKGEQNDLPAVLSVASKKIEACVNSTDVNIIAEKIRNMLNRPEDENIPEEHKNYEELIKRRNPDDFSLRYLESRTYRLQEKTDEEIKSDFLKLSKLYNPFTVLSDDRGETKDFEELAETMIELTENNLAQKEKFLRIFMKLTGPLGSHKKLFMRYFYYYLTRFTAKKFPDLIPIYINISYYDTPGPNSTDNDISADFTILRNIININPEKTFLIILDGIKNFQSRQRKYANDITDFLHLASDIERRCSVISVLDTDFSLSRTRDYNENHPFITSNYSYNIRIRPAETDDENIKNEYIENYTEAFGKELEEKTELTVDAERIKALVKNKNIQNMDSFWFTEVIGYLLRNDSYTLEDVYSVICREQLGNLNDEEDLLKAAELAYKYEYTNEELSYTEPEWRIMRHRRILDYLVARYYVSMLEKLDTSDKESFNKDLPFFSFILPKSISSFVIRILRNNGNNTIEDKILQITENFESLAEDDKARNHKNVLIKNQFIFLLGRVENDTSMEEARDRLEEIREEQKKKYFEMPTDNGNKRDSEKKLNAFLLRSVNVSLFLLGNDEYLPEYFETLICDKRSNTINRAFQLVYYGDIFVPCTANIVDNINDDPKKGRRAFRALCRSVEEKLENRNMDSWEENMLFLDMFNLCSLLQERIIYKDNEENRGMDVTPFIPRIKASLAGVIDRIKNQYDFKLLYRYFCWMNGEILRYFDKGEKYSRAYIFNDLSFPSGNEIITANNIFNSWLIAALYLKNDPDKGRNHYDKEKVLCIILLNRLIKEKVKNEENADTEILDIIRFSGTYSDQIYKKELIEIWEECRNEKENFNLLIAQDIETIESLRHSADEDYNSRLKTEPGKEIANLLLKK